MFFFSYSYKNYTKTALQIQRTNNYTSYYTVDTELTYLAWYSRFEACSPIFSVCPAVFSDLFVPPSKDNYVVTGGE